MTSIYSVSLRLFLLLSIALQSAFVISNELDPPKHINTFQVLLNAKGIESLEDARASNRWEPNERTTNFGEQEDYFWVHLDLTPYAIPKEQLFNINYPMLDEVDAYFLSDGAIISTQRSGDGMPFNDRANTSREILFTIPNLDSNIDGTSRNVEIYLRIKTEGVAKVPIRIWEKSNYNKRNEYFQLWHGFYIGAVFLIALYHLFLYFMLRKVDILAYVIVLIALCTFNIIFWGYSYELFWPGSPEYNNRAILYSLVFSNLAALWFAFSFLSLEKRGNKFKTATISIAILQLLVFFVTSLFEARLLIAAYLSVLVSLLNTLFISFTSGYLLLKGLRIARFYLLANISTIIASAAASYDFVAFVSSDISFADIFAVALLLHICLQAIAIGDKIKQNQLKHEKHILDLNEGLEQKVTERTQELDASIVELKKTQEELIQAEKMAALTGLVAGVAHEINTPLGVGITATTNLKTASQELYDNFSSDKLSRAHLEEHLQNEIESLGLIERSFNRASDQVKSFKLITVDKSEDERRTFNLAEHINDTLLMLKPKLRECDHKIEVECNENIEVYSVPNFYSQIFANLILNSAEHAFNSDTKGTIFIRAKQVEDNLELDIGDNGKGLSSEQISTIFEPFNTSSRGSGHIGLGTTITYNIVTHALKGTINCKSEPGKGICYHICAPNNPKTLS